MDWITWGPVAGDDSDAEHRTIEAGDRNDLDSDVCCWADALLFQRRVAAAPPSAGRPYPSGGGGGLNCPSKASIFSVPQPFGSSQKVR